MGRQSTATMLAALCVLAVTAVHTIDEPIAVRMFSLMTGKGENVLHEGFDRRRLADSFDRLTLNFQALEKQFEFEFEPSFPIFKPGATIKIAGRVSEHNQPTLTQNSIQPLSTPPS